MGAIGKNVTSDVKWTYDRDERDMVGLTSIYLILAIINIQSISLGFDNKICILCKVVSKISY